MKSSRSGPGAAPRKPSSARPLAPAAVLAAWLALGGCATLAPRPLPPAPEARAAVALVEEYNRGFSDLRAQAEVRIQRAQRRDRLTGVLLLRAPASLRFEALAPFGPPLLVVASSPELLTVWEVLDNRATLVSPTPEASARWLGMALGADDVVAVLAGRAPLLRDPRQVTLLPADAVGPALELVDGDVRQRVWLDPASGRPLQIEWTGGRYPARVVFDPADGAAPTGLTLSTLDQTLEVRVRYRDPQWNTGLAPEQLRLAIPESVRIRDYR